MSGKLAASVTTSFGIAPSLLSAITRPNVITSPRSSSAAEPVCSAMRRSAIATLGSNSWRTTLLKSSSLLSK